jgi:hypothetical protein
MGGFVSFAITENHDASSGANAGGAFVWQDDKNECLMLQGGNIFGHSGIFQSTGTFNDHCLEIKSFIKTKIFPNPGIGYYTVHGNNISKIQVIDNLGRVVLDYISTDTKLKEHQIDINEKAEGNYYFKIITDQGYSEVFSIIKINN